ncbi:MAG: hypothetical protein C4523_08150 [Myxococcales bacterium]|nr:MAG: hypothetical protein C4523_08150 [Myxococcales bacterium]
MRKSSGACGLLAAALAVLAVGCPDIGRDEPSTFGYTNDPVLIFNPDWGVLPLPNNFLNPVQQAAIPVAIPGAPAPETPPTTMNLPATDEDVAAARDELGYPAEPDSPLTAALIRGMNKLDGFIPGFVPRLPFSAKLDLDSIVPFEAELDDAGAITESNAAEANLFLFDVTDPEKPTPIAPNKYYRAFNVELLDEGDFPEGFPSYTLTLRNTPSVLLPDDYIQGHTYLIVAAGLTENGIKDTDGRPVWPDSPFLLFNSTVPFVAADGSFRNNLFTDPAKIQELEGARQITDWGVKIWEAVVGGARTRDEIVAAYHFSIATNPMPLFMDPASATLKNRNPLLPKPADRFQNDDNFAPVFVAADAACDVSGNTTCDANTDAVPRFSLSQPVDPATATAETLRLYRDDDGSWSPVDATPMVSTDGKTICLSPAANFNPQTSYLVAVTSGLKGANGRPAADQTYFGLARVADAPLVEDGMWQSPYLDSRIDTLIFMMNSGQLESLDAVTPEKLQQATDTLLIVLGLLEETRKLYETPIDWLVGEAGIVQEREDLALVWTFTTGDCAGGR